MELWLSHLMLFDPLFFSPTSSRILLNQIASQLQISKNFLFFFPMAFTRLSHKLTKDDHRICYIWFGSGEVVQTSHQLMTQSSIHFFRSIIIIQLGILFQRSRHWFAFKHMKSFKGCLFIFSLCDDYLTRCPPNFKTQTMMQFTKILHFKYL